jgi:hypothetical protein
MEKKKKLEEAYDELNKILLFMEYDMSKTYSENVLILSEQKPDEMMPGQIERFGYKQDKPETLGPAHQKQQQYIDDMYKYRHEILQVAAFGTVFIPLAGPFISLGLELADAALYFKEGDSYMGGLTLAFSLIPGSQLIARIPAVKKLSKQGLVRIIKFMEFGPKSKIALTQTEKEVVEQISKNSKWIKYTSALNLVKSSFSKLLEKLSLRNFIKFMMKWKNNNKIKYAIGHTTIQIGGILYTYDKLAEMLGVSPKGEDVPPKASTKKRQELEQSFKSEKPKTQKQVIETIQTNLTDEASLIELQKLMNETLSQDNVSVSSQPKSSASATITPSVVARQKVIEPPTQLSNPKNVKLFQDWLDQNAKGWATGYKEGIINRGQNGGGYGNFGSRTSNAWKKYGNQYLETKQS